MEEVQFVADYFQAEQNESIAFVITGLFMISLTLALAIYYKTSFAKGVAIAVVAIGLVQLIVGTYIYFRSPDDILRVENAINNSPQDIMSIEIPRMQSVLEAFELYRLAEIALVIMGVFLVMLVRRKSMYRGVGFGLALQALIMLILDLFAEARAEVYLQQLMELTT